jgi:hypothetical protein
VARKKELKMIRKNCKDCEMIELLRKGKNGDMIAVPKNCIDCSEMRLPRKLIKQNRGCIGCDDIAVSMDIIDSQKKIIKKLLAENKDLKKALSRKE